MSHVAAPLCTLDLVQAINARELGVLSVAERCR